MSDEFLRVATKEINEDLSIVGTILENCSGYEGIFENAQEIEKRMHKIKGLAPMMGKNTVGDLASLSDSVLKKILSGIKIKDAPAFLRETNNLMKKSMTGSSTEAKKFHDKMKEKYSNILD